MRNRNTKPNRHRLNSFGIVPQMVLPPECHDLSIPTSARKELSQRCHEAHQEECRHRLGDYIERLVELERKKALQAEAVRKYFAAGGDDETVEAAE